MCIADRNDGVTFHHMNFQKKTDAYFDPKSKKMKIGKESKTVYDLGVEVSSASSGTEIRSTLQSPSVRLRRSLSKMMKTSQKSPKPIVSTSKSSKNECTSTNVTDKRTMNFTWSKFLSFLMCEGSISQIFDDTSQTKIGSVAPHQNEAFLMADSPLLQEYRKRNDYSVPTGSIEKDTKVKGSSIRLLERKGAQKKCSGPTLGSFLNISTNKDLVHYEVLDTYMNFRADEFTINIFRQMHCSVPLYHHPCESNYKKNVEEIRHACSEPSSKSFEVRGGSYLLDSKKVLSDETIFSLLGVDNIVKRKGDNTYMEDDICKGDNSYYMRLKCLSEQKGIIMPFLLVINFVVPWGNLLAYFYRPDTGDGSPVNENRRSTPSENLWNDFLDGDQDYRNNTLKFIVSTHVAEGKYKASFFAFRDLTKIWSSLSHSLKSQLVHGLSKSSLVLNLP